MSTQRFRWLVMVTGCLFLLGFLNLESAGQTRTVLKIGLGSDATSLDPAFVMDKNSDSVMGHICERLVNVDPKDYSLKPVLAKRWEKINDKLFRFYLREDVTFQDGTPLNAEAVKYSLERALAPETGSPRRSMLAMIDRINVVDKYVLEIALKYPFGPFMQYLPHQVYAIVSPRAAKQLGRDKFGLQPIGTGPYKFKEWRKGEEIVLTRNENYWGVKPKIDEIRFKVITDSSTRIIALETGQIDVAVNVPAHEADRLKAAPGINIYASPTTRCIQITLNTKVKPFDDVRVRKAVYYAIDKKSLTNAIFGKYAEPGQGVVVSFIFGGKEQPIEYDPKKAKDLMAEAGYPKGFSTDFWVGVGRYPMDKETAALVANQLEKNIGVKADIKLFEWAVYRSKLKSRNYGGIIFAGWGPTTGDADGALYMAFHSSMQKSTLNLANYKNSKVDELLEQARKSTDQDFRRKSYHTILDILRDECPWVPLYYPYAIYALKDYVKGFSANLERIDATGVYFTK